MRETTMSRSFYWRTLGALRVLKPTSGLPIRLSTKKVVAFSLRASAPGAEASFAMRSPRQLPRTVAVAPNQVSKPTAESSPHSSTAAAGGGFARR